MSFRRTTSADSKIFRDTIRQMREEILQREAENQKIQDQLNCLIHLVKRAWLGDETAVVHVSNIVGIPPPENSENLPLKREDAELSKSYQAINNWEKMTKGLLNRSNRMHQKQSESLFKHKLEQRIEDLDILLENHNKNMVATNRKKSTLSLKENHHSDKTDFRPISAKINTSDKEMKFLADPFISGENGQKIKTTTELFDASTIVRRQPIKTSAVTQKKRDVARARPKSAHSVFVEQKSQRPLATETTIPIYNVNSRKIVKSAKTQRKLKEKTINIVAEKDNLSEELEKLHKMEQDFVKSAKNLQKKLGIPYEGSI